MINLLPPEIKEARLYAWRNLALLRATIFLVFAVSTLGAMLGYGYFQLNHTANTVTDSANQKHAQIGDLENLQKQAQGLADTIKTASVLLKREVKFSELIKKIGSVMPPGAYLTSLSLTGDANLPLSITVRLENLEQAPVLQKNLITSDLFEAADIQNVTNSAASSEPGGAAEAITEATLVVSFEDPETAAEKAEKPKLPENFQP